MFENQKFLEPKKQMNFWCNNLIPITLLTFVLSVYYDDQYDQYDYNLLVDHNKNINTYYNNAKTTTRHTHELPHSIITAFNQRDGWVTAFSMSPFLH